MLEEVKSYLKITWDDEDSDITGFIARGKAKLNGLAGVELDFESEGEPKALLMDYCRYAYNNALEYFEGNFQGEILKLQLKAGIEQLGEESTEVV